MFLLILLLLQLVKGETYQLELGDAEEQALVFSKIVKSSVAYQESASENANTSFAKLVPRLELRGSYQYNFTLPEFDIAMTRPTVFGTYQNYYLGPFLSYTLWDFNANRDSYLAASLMAESKEEDRKTTTLSVLQAVREAYIQVQRGVQELRLTYDTLELSRAQERDIAIRFRNGASSQLDVITSQRAVLNYQIQFQKRQTDLSTKLQDLLYLLGENNLKNIYKPGPASIKNVSLVLKFDDIRKTLEKEVRKQVMPPDQNHPQLKSLENQAKSSDLTAATFKAKQLPQLQLFGAVYYTRPNFPNPINYWQEFAGLTLTMPLILGDPAPKQAAEQKKQALALDYRRDQLRNDLQRDFSKVKINLQSLAEQRALMEKDVNQSALAAKLYYSAYKVGKVDLLEVQNANLSALEAKVSLTRVETDILKQITLLKYLSGLEYRNE